MCKDDTFDPKQVETGALSLNAVDQLTARYGLRIQNNFIPLQLDQSFLFLHPVAARRYTNNLTTHIGAYNLSMGSSEGGFDRWQLSDWLAEEGARKLRIDTCSSDYHDVGISETSSVYKLRK